MPKIIEDIQKLLLEETKKQIKEKGYSNVTIRSIAKECNIGVGTFYNYYSSKDMIVASFLIEDWKECLLRMETIIENNSKDLEEIYLLLKKFMYDNETIFKDSSAKESYNTSFSKWHKVLRKQFASIIIKSLDEKDNKEFLSEFLAESLLVWCGEGKEYYELKPIIEVLIK